MNCLRAIGMLFAVLLMGHSAGAEWEADSGDEIQVKAALAIAAFHEKVPRTDYFFDNAYGYAILPSVTRVGFGFGGAYGKGIVVEGDVAIGRTKFWQFSSGIQAGAKNYSMIIFFKAFVIGMTIRVEFLEAITRVQVKLKRIIARNVNTARRSSRKQVFAFIQIQWNEIGLPLIFAISGEIRALTKSNSATKCSGARWRIEEWNLCDFLRGHR